MSEALERLRALVPHLNLAAEMSKIQVPDGELRIAIMSKRLDGSGQIGASFEFEPFLKDILGLLGYENIEDFNRAEFGAAATTIDDK